MLTKLEVKECLRNVGLTAGDHLFVHSSLRQIGPIDGGADALIDALLETVGTEGTLAMPAFNYSRPLPIPCFDVSSTPSRAGLLTEMYRRRPGTLRSLHPSHSVAAQGRRAPQFLAEHLEHGALTMGSPIDRMAQAGAYILLIGVTHLANSCIHIGESYAGIRKFYREEGAPPVAKIRLPDGKIIEYQLDCSASCSMAFNSVEFPLRHQGLIVDLMIGQAESFLMKGKDVINVVVEMLRERRDALLCNRDSCRSCCMSRKFINRSFHLDRHV